MREPTAPAYYDRRATEYDDWYLGTGLFTKRDRDGWYEALAALCASLEALPPAGTLDVACGTGFLTRHLRGTLTGLDQSARMLAIAQERIPRATFVLGDGIELAFPNDAYDRIVTGHFYGHLDERQRLTFLENARRVAAELVVVDASREYAGVDEEWSKRQLGDGSCWEVYKRYFEPETLLRELGGGEVVFAGRWFVVVRSHRRPRRPVGSR